MDTSTVEWMNEFPIIKTVINSHWITNSQFDPVQGSGRRVTARSDAKIQRGWMTMKVTINSCTLQSSHQENCNLTLGDTDVLAHNKPL